MYLFSCLGTHFQGYSEMSRANSESDRMVNHPKLVYSIDLGIDFMLLVIRLAYALACGSIFLINLWCGKARAHWGSAVPGLVCLSYIFKSSWTGKGKQSGQHCSSTAPTSSCRIFLPWFFCIIYSKIIIQVNTFSLSLILNIVFIIATGTQLEEDEISPRYFFGLPIANQLYETLSI